MPTGIYKRTKKIRISLSKARIGKAPWNKGTKVDREKHPKMGHFFPHSEAAKRKMKKNHKGMLGKKHKKETILKMISSQKKIPHPKGEKSGNWRGGKRRYLCKETLKRDNYTCKKCGLHDKEIMQVDHIIERIIGGLDNLKNLQTLCPNCHWRKTIRFLKQARIKTQTFRPREEWR